MDDPSDLYRWYVELQRTHADRAIIAAIERRTAESDGDARRTLSFILASEFCRQEQYAEAESILIEISEQDPGEPYPLVALAEQKLYYEDDPAVALAIIEQAVRRARAAGGFCRNALGVQARMSEKLGRFDLIEGVLREIMSIPFPGSRVDVGIERDFIDRLPAGTIDATLRARYDAFCCGVSKTSS